MSAASQPRVSSPLVPVRLIRRAAQWMRWLSCALLLALALPALADEEEDQYFGVLEIIQKADALTTSGQLSKALTKYQQAQASLQNFHRDHPDWNPKVISYRTRYLAEKIALCSEKLSAPAAGTKPGENKSTPSGTSDSSEPRSGAQIKLLEAGSEPRKALRLH